MSETFCPRCGVVRAVVGFRRDCPRLVCGHVLSLREQLVRDELYLVVHEALSLCAFSLVREGWSYKQAVKKIFGVL